MKRKIEIAEKALIATDEAIKKAKEQPTFLMRCKIVAPAKNAVMKTVRVIVNAKSIANEQNIDIDQAIEAIDEAIVAIEDGAVEKAIEGVRLSLKIIKSEFLFYLSR